MSNNENLHMLNFTNKIINSLQEPIHVVNREMDIVLYNKSFVDALNKYGFSGETIIGENLFSLCLFIGEDVQQEYQKVLESGETLVTVDKIVFCEEVIWSETQKIPLYDNNNEIQWVMTVIRDISKEKKSEEYLHQVLHDMESQVTKRTEEIGKVNEALRLEITKQKQSEKALKQSREALAAQYWSIPIPTYTWQRVDGQMILTNFNKAAIEITEGKISKYLGITAENLYSGTPEILEEMRTCFAQKKVVRREMSYCYQSTGRTKILSVQYAYVPPDTVMVHTEDISRKRRVELELQRAHKLESIGMLAGGIAHDFNNYLMGFLGSVDLALKKLEKGQPIIDILKKAEQSATKARMLTTQLLTFARGGSPIKKPVMIQDVIQTAVEFGLNNSGITSQFTFQETLWAVEADENQINQVFHNLTVNSLHAMPDGGSIKVIAENVLVKPQDKTTLKKGKYVKIKFQDTGKGIDSDDQRQVFDPFFSTKQDGTGLGLSISYSIIKKHNGLITLESESGKGATFTIYLPATDKPVDLSGSSQGEMESFSGKILLMDDETTLQNTLQIMLEDYGFDVAFVSDGSKALQLFNKARQTDTPFDVVVLDLLVANGMGGEETIDELLKIDPDVKAIVSSGYADSKVLAQFKKYGFSDCIIKPYKASKLANKIQKLMND